VLDSNATVACFLQVFEGGLKFMREVLPKFVLSEVD
jgi:hypothetical protein